MEGEKTPGTGAPNDNGTGAQNTDGQGAGGNGQQTQTPPAGSERERELLAELQAVRKEAAERRVTLNKFEEDRRKAEEAAMIEQNKFKELAEAREKQLNELTGKAAEAEKLREQLNKLNEARRAELLARLPEGLRAKDVYKTMDLAAFEEIVKDFSTTKPGNSPGVNDGGNPPGGNPYEGKKLSDLTQEQQLQLMQTNRPLFDKMLSEQYKRPA